MLQHYKALLAVMLITVLTFRFVRPLMRNFMADADFIVRRNVWLGMTVAAFAIPFYWVYVLIASVLLVYGAKRDSNPAALYVFLLLAMVPIGLDVPTFGMIKQLLFVDHLQLLSIVLLLPVAIQLAKSSRPPASAGQLASPADRARRQVDALILIFLGLQVVLLLPYESLTTSMRRVVLSFLAVWLPYYVVSRSCRMREQIVEVMAALALAMLVLTPLAVLEVAKGWLLYAGLQDQWATSEIMNYLRRGDILRAQVTAGHSIVLGFAMTIGFGFWLYLRSRVTSFGWRIAALLMMLVGMAMPAARGPWLGAGVVLLAFVGLGPNRGRRIIRVLGLMGVLGVIAVASPYGEQIVDRLPLIGTLDEGTVTYRQQLAQMSWMLIQQNPWFGTPGFLSYMEELRQGQGIIDLVNAYAGIALAFGLFTLAAFVAFLSLIIVRCVGALLRLARSDPDLSLLGASLVACLLGSMFMIAAVNLYLSVSYLIWSMAGLGLAYSQVAREEMLATTNRPLVGPAPAAWPA